MLETRARRGFARLCAGLLALLAATAHAQSVYRCRSARGEIAYQDRACGANEQQTEMAFDPPPAAMSAAHERTPPAREHAAPARAGRRPRGAAATHTAMSWQCRAADGAVFYRHGACPKSIAAHGASSGARRGGRGAGGTVSVSATPLPRSEACRRLAREPGRTGREHDEVVSTYERNAGRDPCR